MLEKEEYSLPDGVSEYQDGGLGREAQRKRSKSITEDGLGVRKKYAVGQEKMIV